MSRNLHLGLDWGTSATKLVLRDYDAVGTAVAYAVRTSAGGLRHPSVVVLEESRLWFGEDAVRRRANAADVWTDLKAKVALNGQGENDASSGLTLRDISALYLAHILRVAGKAASSLPNGDGTRLGFKLGVPAAQLNGWSHATEYLAIARAARQIAFDQGVDPNGYYPAQVKPVLTKAWEDVKKQSDRATTTGEVIEAWLRAEAASEMVWPLNSPQIRPGFYTAVDVGAGTTNACFFMIHDSPRGAGIHGKRALSFFGAECSSPGLNALITALLQDKVSPNAIEQLRGNENAAIRDRPGLAQLALPIVEQFRKVWFRARQQAWGRYPGNTNWDGLHLLTVGGGRTVDLVREAFERAPPVNLIDNYTSVSNLGVPSDLCELPVRVGVRGRGFVDDPTFMLVAYGLSFETDDLPEITLPYGVAPFRPAGRVRQFLEHDDLGYEER